MSPVLGGPCTRGYQLDEAMLHCAYFPDSLRAFTTHTYRIILRSLTLQHADVSTWYACLDPHCDIPVRKPVSNLSSLHGVSMSLSGFSCRSALPYMDAYAPYYASVGHVSLCQPSIEGDHCSAASTTSIFTCGSRLSCGLGSRDKDRDLLSK